MNHKIIFSICLHLCLWNVFGMNDGEEGDEGNGCKSKWCRWSAFLCIFTFLGGCLRYLQENIFLLLALTLVECVRYDEETRWRRETGLQANGIYDRIILTNNERKKMIK